MYHQDDNLYFGRNEDGSVRVLKLSETPPAFPQIDDEFPDAVLDVAIEPSQWASIVASVSAGDEDYPRHREALAFHMD